jgi:hypothetical protein
MGVFAKVTLTIESEVEVIVVFEGSLSSPTVSDPTLDRAAVQSGRPDWLPNDAWHPLA